MREEDVQVVGIGPRLLGGSLEQELGMVDDVLVDGCRRRDEHGDRGAPSAARATELLPRARDRAGIASQDRCIESPDVDSKLERVRGDDAAQLTVAQPMLDHAPLGREVAAAIAPHPRARAVRLAE